MAKRISQSLWRLKGCDPSLQFVIRATFDGSNSYVFQNGIMIDTGSGKEEHLHNLYQLLEAQDIQLKAILVTHSHPDHIGGVQYIKERLNDVVVYRYSNQDEEGVVSVDDRQILNIQGLQIQAFHTPGHYFDHICYYLPNTNELFTGDLVIGYESVSMDNYGQYMQSLNILKELQPQILYPGHGEVITKGIEKIQQYIDHRLGREQQILRCLESGSKTVGNLMDEMYGSIDPLLKERARINLLMYLQRLIDINEIALQDDHYSKVQNNKMQPNLQIMLNRVQIEIANSQNQISKPLLSASQANIIWAKSVIQRRRLKKQFNLRTLELDDENVDYLEQQGNIADDKSDQMKNLGKEDDESVINLSTNVSISENVNEDKVLIRKQNLNRIIQKSKKKRNQLKQFSTYTRKQIVQEMKAPIKINQNKTLTKDARKEAQSRLMRSQHIKRKQNEEVYTFSPCILQRPRSIKKSIQPSNGALRFLDRFPKDRSLSLFAAKYSDIHKNKIR